MGKNVLIGVDTLFCPIVVYICLCKYFSVRGHDRPSHHTVRKSILPCIIRAVYKILAADCIKINQIADQAHENSHKKVGDKNIFFIFGPPFFRSFTLDKLLFFLEFFAPLLFFVSQFPRPRLLLKYISPE